MRGNHPVGFGDDLMAPTRPGDAQDPAWLQFHGQFVDYSHQAHRNRLAYQSSMVVVVVLGAAVTLAAALGAAGWLTGSLSAIVVVLTSLQATFQWQASWTDYRGAAEAMRQQGMLFLEASPPYDGDNRREQLSAVRLSIATAELNRWTARIAQKRSSS